MPPKPPTIRLPSAPLRCLHSHPLRASKCRPLPPSNYPHRCVRQISTYGYTQAKALVYSSHGSPSDVLSYAPFTTTLGTPSPSAIPGSEACLEVLSTGASVHSLKPGDWVIPQKTGLGTWRTHMQVPEDAVMKIDEGFREKLSAVDVGSVTVNPVTAWCLLRNFGGMRAGKGEWWVQNGANSGVGRMALQFGRMWGMKGIAVVRGREGEEGEKLKRELLALGAEKVVTEEELASRDFQAQVRLWTNGEKIKLALNCIGGDSMQNLAKILSDGGTMVTYGAMSKKPMRLGAGMLIFRNLRFEGFWVSRWAEGWGRERKRVIEEILGLMAKGEVKGGPVEEVQWGVGTGREELVRAVEGTLEGGRGGKGVFVFRDT